MILVDILTACALAGLFVVVVSEMHRGPQVIFASAHDRSHLMNVYEMYSDYADDMMPGDSRTRILMHDEPPLYVDGVTMQADARWYGNDRIQTDTTVSFASNHPLHSSVMISAIRAYPFASYLDSIGTSLCSVEIGSAGEPIITPFVLPINPLLPLTDIIVRNKIAYISVDSATASDPDVLVVDMNYSPPRLLSSIDTGPGISAIALAQDRIYAAAASTQSQLHIIRITDTSSLILEHKMQLPLPYATATPPYASALEYHKGLLYIGTEKWTGDEMVIIDVSRMAHTTPLGGVDIGSKVSDIYVRNNVAYVTSSHESQVSSIDVSDPTYPTRIDTLNPSGWERQEGKSLDYFEQRLQVGRTSGGFNITRDHELFSWATSSDSLHDLYISTDVKGGVYGIITDRSHVYVATGALDKEFQMYDRTLSSTTVRSFSLPVAPETMVCDMDHLYILARTAPVVYDIHFDTDTP